MYFCGPLHVDEQKQDDQPEPIYNSSVPIRDIARKTCQKQWTIGRGGERGLGISVLMAWDDDDDDDKWMCLCAFIWILNKIVKIMTSAQIKPVHVYSAVLLSILPLL